MLQVHNMIKWIINSRNDDTLTNLAKKEKIKYDRYWENYDDINYLLFVCVVLDPMCKLKYVQ